MSIRLANLICVLSMLVWSASLPAADHLIAKVPPLPLTGARMALAALVLLPIWLIWEGRAALAGARWGRGLLIGGATIGVGAVFTVMGQARTSAVAVAVISATIPVVGLALEVTLDGRRLTAGIVVGLILSLLGAGLALWPVIAAAGIGGAAGGAEAWLGALFLMTSVLTYTLGSRWTVTALPALSPLGGTTVTLTGAAVATCVASALHAAMGGPVPDMATLGWVDFGALAIFGIGGMAAAQVLWIVAVGRLGIAVASLHYNAGPFYVMLIMVALGGAWSLWQVLGAAVVLAGVLVAQGRIASPAAAAPPLSRS